MYEPSHSPFGFVWQVATTTGWSVDYILHHVNYQTLVMMMADAPRHITPDKPDTHTTPQEEAQHIIAALQSRL